VVDAHVTPEVACAAIERIAGALPVVLVLSWLRLGAQWIIRVGDVVLQAVARYLSDPLLPLGAQPRLYRTLAEAAHGPGARGVNLVLGELVADVGGLLCDLDERALQPLALSADLARFAQLPYKALTLGGHGGELAIDRMQSARQVRVLDGVAVLLASEESAWLRQTVDTLGGERDRACVEVLDALQLPGW
jgi:hypothetical protein